MNDPPSLPLIATFALNVVEPSDLTINESGTVLWTVNNNPDSKPDRVYELDTDGNVIKQLSYDGGDLEGITYDPSDSTLWVAEENKREIVHLDLDGKVLSKKALGLTGENNSGLEGICIDTLGHMFVLNEKNPGLFIELDATHAISSEMGLTFAGDYSGITFDRRENKFWIVSDQSRGLYLWSKATGVTKHYAVPFDKAEGVAVDLPRGLMYVVSDATNSLYVYQLK